MIFNNPFFKSLLDTKEPYYKELRNIAVPLSDYFYKKCEKAIKGRTDISEETRDFLNEFVLSMIDFCSSCLLPFIGLTTRIFVNRPENCLEENNKKVLKNVAFTYSDLYDTLKGFPQTSAELLILKICSDSSITSRLVSSFRNDEKNAFCETIYSTNEDYSNYLYQIYNLGMLYTPVNSVFQIINAAIDNDSEIELQNIVKEIMPQGNVNPITIAANAAQTTSETPISEEEERWFTHRLQVLISCIDKLDDEHTFINDIINQINAEGQESFSDSIWWGVEFFTFFSCALYSRLRERMPKEERDIYEDLFKLQPSNYMDYINDMIRRVNEDPQQEGSSIDDKVSDIYNEVFLPSNFFNRENRTSNKDSVGIIDGKYIEKGVGAYCSLINFIAAEGFIDDTPKSKRNFAFKLSGYYREYDQGVIHWQGDTNILSVLIQKLCYAGDKWDRAKRMFECDSNLFNSSTLRKKIATDKDFADLFQQLYDIDLYK